MIDPNIIANLHNYIVINPQLAIVGERLQLKRLVRRRRCRAGLLPLPCSPVLELGMAKLPLRLLPLGTPIRSATTCGTSLAG